MTKIILMFVAAVMALQIVQAQGTVYLSNLDQPSAGNLAVGSDSWLAAVFLVGNNVNGYNLNSVQLGMVDASGNPNGFTIMLYTMNGTSGEPKNSLGTLNGSLNPGTAGTYTYTPASNLTLFPGYYFIVLTAGTAVANGAYEWSLASTYSNNPTGGWGGGWSDWTSSNGSSWNEPTTIVFPQFAITATAIPELSMPWLLLLGSGIFLYVRCALHR